MITWFFVPLGLILPDQPNRVVRTRTLCGVGGALCEGRPYPDRRFLPLDYVEEEKLNLSPFSYNTR